MFSAVSQQQVDRMAGTKRSHTAMEVENTPGNASGYIPIFEFFRTELDEHHDRRERIIKASRDVTAQSKKIIFALQRARELGRPVHQSISKQITPMYATIRDLLQNVVADLQGIDSFRYQRNISGGIQEYMEAVFFQHYLETQRVMLYDEAAKALPEGIMLTYEDYVLGLFDMTGELMRFAITYMATNGKLPGLGQNGDASTSILADMQTLRSHLELLDPSGSYGLSKDYEGKMKTTRNSVEKVENSVYSMTVRGKERPKGWRPDISLGDRAPDIDAIDGD